MSSKPIGVFDSGIGGLTVLKELLARLPDESYVYFGDTARVPYGTKSAETVLRFSRENVRLLLGVRWYHVSNGRLDRDNPGIDSLYFWAGLSVGF